ncbi:TPA: DUF4376 domain-containing protein [Providencia alcalifaciens]
MRTRAVKDIRNAHYLENGAVDCEVLFEGEPEFVPYTAMQGDSAPTGQRIWQELKSGKWGGIASFTVTPELIAAAKNAKRQEINAWREEQESLAFTIEWGGYTWNAGTDSLARLYPLVTASKLGLSRDVMTWGDAENQPVMLSMLEFEELAGVMAQAQVERNNDIYQRQRVMKDKLEELNELDDIRNFRLG